MQVIVDVFNYQQHEPDLNHVFQTDSNILSMIQISLNLQNNKPGSQTEFKFFCMQNLGEQNIVSITNCEVLMTKLDKDDDFSQMDQKKM